MRVVPGIIFAALASATLPGIAVAQSIDPDGEARVVLQTSDLDLATEHGQKQLDRRMRAAAEAVCPDLFAPLRIGRTAVCRRDAFKRASVQRDRIVARAIAARAGEFRTVSGQAGHSGTEGWTNATRDADAEVSEDPVG